MGKHLQYDHRVEIVMNESTLIAAIASMAAFIVFLVKWILNHQDKTTKALIEVSNSLNNINDKLQEESDKDDKTIDCLVAIEERFKHHDEQTEIAHRNSVSAMRRIARTAEMLCKNGHGGK